MITKETPMTDDAKAARREEAALATASAATVLEAVELAAEAAKIATDLQEKFTELAGGLFTAVDRAHAALERGAADEALAILEPFALACPADPSSLPSAI